MNITFILPGPGIQPVGGFKIVYEYANHLCARGHHVSIIHPAMLDHSSQLLVKSKKLARYVQRIIDKSYFPRKWFVIDPRIRMLWVPNLNEKFIPDADAVIATAWQTAEWVADYAAAKGRKYYLIQHYETWGGSEESVRRTWTLPLCKIVIARWLENVAKEIGENSFYIPNGLDFSSFGQDLPIDERNPRSIMMLYHEQAWKGSQDGIQALLQVRKFYPDLQVTMFGVSDGSKLPDWVRYYRLPDQKLLRYLYNQSAIFVAPSWSEGWGLPASEAMMCGCALVATDIGGHKEFALDNHTALLAEPKKPESLAGAILRLVEDSEKRLDIARTGNRYIQQFTWSRACGLLEDLILQNGIH
ncbi:glycosyltransferase family 4 protein [Acidithiobacillus ferrooxidans]|uniref:glycosyltransferase family 4 protein n=1 Tax=Acidithiobacillus ferrooxidans TaxID=920 RepID=UPI0013D6C235|nr:glycosyltransferase family 4 protein [Acidithiobacillus ferrooxidans]MCR2830912.1 glycosyltransferase family 4 protein [Acidithiobacillus ferrooxidans]